MPNFEKVLNFHVEFSFLIIFKQAFSFVNVVYLCDKENFI